MKYFIRKEADKIRIYSLKKGTRQIVSIKDRAYGTDDQLFYRDPKTSDAYVLYDIDDSQPYRHTEIYYPTRNLSILNVSSKAANNRRKRFINLTGDKLYTYFGAVIVGGALLYYVIGRGFF